VCVLTRVIVCFHISVCVLGIACFRGLRVYFEYESYVCMFGRVCVCFHVSVCACVFSIWHVFAWLVGFGYVFWYESYFSVYVCAGLCVCFHINVCMCGFDIDWLRVRV